MANSSLEKIAEIEKRLSETHETIQCRDETCIVFNSGWVGHLIPLFGGVVMEYYESVEDAKNDFADEDGDIYDLSLPVDELVRLLEKEGEE